MVARRVGAALFMFVGLRAATVYAQEDAEPPGDTADPAEQPGESNEVDERYDAEAHSWFQAGRSAFSDGRYEDALTAFRRAYDLSRRPALLFNIGASAEHLQRDLEALEAFQRYVELVPDAGNRREVEARIRALRRTLYGEEEEESPEPDVGQLHGGSAPSEGEGSSRGVASQWWFWTAIGGVVAVVAVVVGVTLAGGGHQPFMEGDIGGTIMTLRDW